MTGPEAKREYMRKWREKNREKILEYDRKYRAEHREQFEQYNQSYWERVAERENTR